MRLAVYDSTGSPWVISLWFLFKEGRFWCATDRRAKLAEYLRANPRCGFEVAGDTPPYKGVRGKGLVEIVPSSGGEILVSLLRRYKIDMESKLAKMLLAKIQEEVAICITPSSMSSWDFTERMSDAIATNTPLSKVT